MSPSAPIWTSPERLRIEGELIGDKADLRVGDEIAVSFWGNEWTCVVVEISKRDAFSPIRWFAESKAVIEGRA